MNPTSTPDPWQHVIVVGAGPVGLVAAIDLAQRGVRVTLLERRKHWDSTTVRCNHISARSMEIFRRMGVAETVRAAGFRDDFPHDVAVRLCATGEDIGRIHIPGRAGRRDGAFGVDTWWPTPEPPHRMNQIFLEPVLQDLAERTPGLTVFLGSELTRLVDHDTHVSAYIRTDGGDEHQLDAAYVIGCDGGASLVRKHMGASLHGTAMIQQVQSTYIHAPGLTERMSGGEAWAILNINLRRSGTVYTIDNNDRFLVHNYIKPGEDPETVDRDSCLRTILGVGPDFQYAVLRVEDWVGRRLMADRMRRNRVFLAGDSAHLWVPMAGYGMNAGIADAAGLTWMLAAVMQQWAAPGLLDAYESERWPITEQVSHHAMRTAEIMIKNRAAVPANIEDQSEEGAQARADYGAQTCALNTPQYACAGLNFGYYYDRSPIIVYDEEPAPSYTMDQYTPSTVPGCRFAHVFMADGSSIYDHLGRGYTLFRTRGDLGGDLIAAAQSAGVPLHVVEIPQSVEHPHGLYLVRPDAHVAWRADADPSKPDALWNKLCGRVRETL